MCVLTLIILCARISYLINSKIFRLKLSSQEVNPLLLQRGIDPRIHLLNYSLRSKTLSESLMRMEKNNYYIMGDFNCNMLPESFYNATTQALLSITDIYNLKQLISEPTRITPSSSTLIDVIFTNLPDNTNCSGVSHIGISDHSLIYVYRKISSPSVTKGTSTITYRQFKNFNRNSFRSDVLAQPWDDLKGVHNPNEMWLKWKTLFLEVSDVHAPFRSKRVRGFKSPWITTELKKMKAILRACEPKPRVTSLYFASPEKFPPKNPKMGIMP